MNRHPFHHCLLILLFTVAFYTVFAQTGVRIATSAGTADPSAMLDVTSNSKGVLIPRMSASERTGISSPATGLLVFQTDGTPGFYYNAGTPGTPNWVVLSAGALSGVGVTNQVARWTTPSILGTGVITDNGSNVGIGITSPGQKLDVAGRIIVHNGGVAYNNPGAAELQVGYALAASGGTPGEVARLGLQPYGHTGGPFLFYNRDDASSAYLDIRYGSSNLVSFVHNGNVGIGTQSPTQKLQVAGNVKANQLDIANAADINISLNACGGACGSYHALNAWVNVGSYGYPWATNQNTATDVFSHNGAGTITILQSGVYTIRLYSMTIPASTVNWIVQNVPFINGNPDGAPGGGNNQLHHAYDPAGYWRQDVSEFTRPLSAGTTVSFGYYAGVALSYWAHDGYTGLEIRRVN